MGKRAPDREKNWEKIFNAMVTLTKNLEKDRAVLQARIKYLNGVVCKMKMAQRVESAKAELLLGLKEREASVYQHRYADADSELDELHEWFEHPSLKCAAPANTSDAVCEGSQTKELEVELTKLKDELDFFRVSKNSEISALLSEKKFIWNQYNKMESDLNEKLKKKDLEVEKANERLSSLINRMEELQFSNETLTGEIAKSRSESDQKSKEISRLLEEIEHLKSRPALSSPLLRTCKRKAVASRERTDNSSGGVSLREVKKEVGSLITWTRQNAHVSSGTGPPSRHSHAKGCGSSSKRKTVQVTKVGDEQTPQLFTSSFKVPKLRSSFSQQVR